MSTFIDPNKEFCIEVFINGKCQKFLNARFNWLGSKHFQVKTQNGDFIDFKADDLRVKIISMYTYHLIQSQNCNSQKN